MEKRNTTHFQYSNKLVIFTLFFLCIGIHYLLSSYTKRIFIANDEVLYYSIANSLWHGQGVAVNNAAYDFQKILYSIMIMPAFSITNVLLRNNVIALINSIAICSGIFPVYLLAKRYLKNNKHVLYVCVLFCVFSDLTYATTFLAENLYLPMGLWAVYFSSAMLDKTSDMLQGNTKLDNKKYYIFSVLFGIYFYALFLCKEVGAVFPLTYSLFVIGLIIRSKMKDKQVNKNGIIHVSLVVLGFAAVYLLFRFIVFPNTLGGGYQSAESDLKEGFDYFYMYYGFVYYLLMIILAYGVFPILIPLIQRKKLEEKDRYFSDYLLIMLIITAAVVAFKITVGENWAETTPRIHLRYICCMFIPIVIMMLNAFEHTDSIPKKPIVICTVALSFVFVYLGILGNNTLVPELQILDQTMLQYLSHSGNSQMIILGIVCLVFVGNAVLISKKYRKGIILCLTTLLVLNVINTIQNTLVWRSAETGNEITEDELNQALRISDYVKENSDKNILFLVTRKEYEINLTYTAEANSYALNTDTLQAYLTEHTGEELAWKDMKEGLKLPRLNAYYDDLEKVDVIVISDDLQIEVSSEDSQIVDTGWDGFKVYSINDSAHVPDLSFNDSTIKGMDAVDQQIDDALKKYQEKQSQTSTAE
jgi:hypothetical protein